MDIIKAFNKALSTKCSDVKNFDDKLQALVKLMGDIMYENKGVGLAANQIGCLTRVVVIDTTYDTDGLRNLKVFVNPEIIEQNEEVEFIEGCLSVPDCSGTTRRFKKVKVRYKDIMGTQQEIEAEGLEAVALQHEIDHINGILYIDHLPKYRRSRIAEKMYKRKKK